MPLLKEQPYTTDYIYSLPDGQRAELIDGTVYDMAPPSRQHQEISGDLFTKIKNHMDANSSRCKPYIAPFAVFLNADNKTYVEPDISVVCDKNKLSDRGCEGAPDWIIEIVSPSSRSMDYLIKMLKYNSAGVREYWVVDPEKNRVTVYNFDHKKTEEYTFSDAVQVGIYPDLTIDFRTIVM